MWKQDYLFLNKRITWVTFPCRSEQVPKEGAQAQKAAPILGDLTSCSQGSSGANSLFCLSTHQVMFPVFLGEQVPSETLAATLAELDVNLWVLEDKFLQDKAFLVGPHISLADLVAITEVMHVSALKRAGP